MNPAKVFAALLGLALGLFSAASSPQDAALEPLSAFPQSMLAIRTHSGNVHNFNVWIADRESRQEQGLMFVRALEDHHSMLFVYANDVHITMWMKNTWLSLDMLFIRADGSIAHITQRATPQSLNIIEAPGKLRAVLEVDGGTADRLGIHVGDQVFSDALPARPGASHSH